MIAKVFLLLIKFYQYFISPLIGPRCRFHPTCSNYSYHAIKLHGLKGVILSIKRILRCNPFGNFGFDSVPECSVPEYSVAEATSNPKLKMKNDT